LVSWILGVLVPGLRTPDSEIGPRSKSYVDVISVDNVEKSVNKGYFKGLLVYKCKREKPHYLCIMWKNIGNWVFCLLSSCG